MYMLHDSQMCAVRFKDAGEEQRCTDKKQTNKHQKGMNNSWLSGLSQAVLYVDTSTPCGNKSNCNTKALMNDVHMLPSYHTVIQKI